MSFENKYPYTDFHELNLDWFLKEFKTLVEENTSFKDDMTARFNTLDDTVREFTTFVRKYFNNLDVQEEINNKLDAMAADGTLDALLLPYFNAYKAEINENIARHNAATDETLENQDERIAVLEGRMDEFASLPDGSTAGNAELLDIRIGYDGEPYPSAGDAVRGQIEDLNDKFDDINDSLLLSKTVTGNVLSIPDSVVNYVKSVSTAADKIFRSGDNIWDEEWENGYYSTQGEPGYSTTQIRSKLNNPIPVQPSTQYYIKNPFNSGIMFYDVNLEFISYTTAMNSNFTTPATCYYIRFYLVTTYGPVYNDDVQITLASNPNKTVYHANNVKTYENASKLTLLENTQNYVYAVGNNANVSVTYFYSQPYAYIPKKQYEPGFIIFTVPSRITKADDSVPANQTSEGTDDSVNVNCIMKLPSSYTPNGDPVKLIMICHGAGQSAEQWATNASYKALTDAFVNAGYAIFDCNGYRENALGYSFWGDPRGVDVWRKAYQYVIDNYNVEHEFGLYGFSMGGLTALNLAFSRFPGIKCIALGSPVVNLEDVFNSNDGNKAVINLLYNMGSTYDPAKAYGCNPFSRIIEIDSKEYIFCDLPPIKAWYGSTEDGTSTDPGTGEILYGVVSKYTGKELIDALCNAGNQGEYREVEGAGHEICYGGNAVVNQDLVLYFNRHNKI